MPKTEPIAHNAAQMATIRWGILGCGDVCERKSGPAFQKAIDSALVAVMRRDAAKARDFAQRHNVASWYDDADALINARDVDAVYIATPPGTHAELAFRVARAGKPCCVEKPMARSYAECARMIDAFKQANRPLFVAYYRRAQPRFVKAKQVLDSGAMGRITGATSRHTRLYWPDPKPEWRLDAEQSGGGLLLDVGSHTLDLLDWMLGEFIETSGSASSFSTNDVEDAVALHFRTSRGVAGTAYWNFAGASKEDMTTIDATEGRMMFSTFGDDLRIESKIGVEELKIPPPEHVHQPLIQTIVDDLLGRGKCPSTAESAARTSHVMDAALAAYYGGRDDEFWKRRGSWPGKHGER